MWFNCLPKSRDIYPFEFIVIFDDHYISLYKGLEHWEQTAFIQSPKNVKGMHSGHTFHVQQIWFQRHQRQYPLIRKLVYLAPQSFDRLSYIDNEASEEVRVKVIQESSKIFPLVTKEEYQNAQEILNKYKNKTNFSWSPISLSHIVSKNNNVLFPRSNTVTSILFCR